MATVPAVAYLGDRYEYIDWRDKWGAPPFLDARTFQDGAIGQSAQNSISGLSDGWDDAAGGSTYSDEVLYKGRQVCRCQLNDGKDGELYFGGTVTKGVSAKLGQSVWQQVTVYIPSSFDFSVQGVADSMKFLRQTIKGIDYANSPDEDGNIVTTGRNHADLYVMRPDEGKVFKYTFENHTNGDLGHETHNSKREFLDKTVRDIPRDEWVNVQFMVTHDYHRDNLADSRCVIRTWINDDLVNEILGTEEVWHSFLDENDEVFYTNFITYYNGLAGKSMHLYVAEYEHSNVTPTYTDAHGNPKLPPRI